MPSKTQVALGATEAHEPVLPAVRARRQLGIRNHNVIERHITGVRLRDRVGHNITHRISTRRARLARDCLG